MSVNRCRQFYLDRLCSILWIKSENRVDILGRHKLSILSTLSTLTFIRLNLNIYFTDDKYTVHLVYTAVELFFLYLTLYLYYNGIESVCETIKKNGKQSNVVRLKNVTHFPALGVCYLLSVKNPFTKSYTFDTSLLLFPFFLVLLGIYLIILYACVQLAMTLNIKPSNLYYKVLEKVWYSLAVPSIRSENASQ